MEIDKKQWVKIRAWIKIHHRELYNTYQKEKKYGTKDAQKAMAKMVKLYDSKPKYTKSELFYSTRCKKGEWRGGGRKKLPVEKKGVQTSFYLKPHQVAIVREFVEKLREEEKRQNSISKQA